VQDIVTAAAMLAQYPWQGSRLRKKAGDPGVPVDIVGLKGAGAWCMLARIFCPTAARTIVDLSGLFPAASGSAASDVAAAHKADAAWERNCYIPGLRRAGDIVTAAALIAPAPLAVFGAGGSFPGPALKRMYKAAGAPGNLMMTPAPLTAARLTQYLDPSKG